MLEAIEEASTPKLKLDEVKKSVVVAKKIIQGFTQIDGRYLELDRETLFCNS